jgi:hypothetical protein
MTTTKPKWTDIKKQLTGLEQKELISLISELFKLSAGNREFLAARFLNVQTGEALEIYRKRIIDEFFPARGFGDPKLRVARRAISDYKKATGNLVGTLDLMLTYVETGTEFTNTYGDLWESFYSSMESVLNEIAHLLFQHGEQLYNEVNTAQRLWKLQSNASHIGWGYGDYVTDRIDEIRDHFGDI